MNGVFLMITSVDLSQLNYAFNADTSLENLKRVNYFYGKNGTGKSSLVRAIKNQYGNDYNVQVFSGSNSLIFKNENLDAISLGQENAEAANEIKQYDSQIAELDKDVLASTEENGSTPNLFQRQKQASRDLQSLNTQLNKLYRNAAKELKNHHTLITGPNYDKNAFARDIVNAASLSETELSDSRETLSAKVLDLSKSSVPNFPQLQNLSNLQKAVNNILTSSVQSHVVLEEFINQPAKEDFAYNGMKIHKREKDERCAFCGNLITENRWQQLDNYFSDEVDKFQNRIKKGLNIITVAQQQLEEEFIFPQSNWQPKFWGKLNELQIMANEHRKVVKVFITTLEKALNDKQNSPFKTTAPVTLEVPKDFTELTNSLQSLWLSNMNYNASLSGKQKTAIAKLRYHYVFQKLISGNHKDLLQKIADVKSKGQTLNQLLDEKQALKDRLEASKANAISRTTSEKKAAEDINQLVKNLGDDSFSLQSIQRTNQPQGLYQVIDRNGQPRPLTSLSTGELNLLSFLWFRYHLEDVNDPDNRKRIIIFDDPVNSNDDNSQYLILAEIQELISSNLNDQFFVFTHNNHFYVQLRPTKYKNKGIFHLRRTSKANIIRINSPKDDLSTIYEDLWKELHFLCDNNRIVSTWNCMRRILETYGRFNFANQSPRDTEKYINTATDQVLYLSLLKSLNVNSHIGLDTDMDLSGRNIKALLQAFYEVFHVLNADNHFLAYWGSDLQK